MWHVNLRVFQHVYYVCNYWMLPFSFASDVIIFIDEAILTWLLIACLKVIFMRTACARGVLMKDTENGHPRWWLNCVEALQCAIQSIADLNATPGPSSLMDVSELRYHT